jgi:hypothetical protein
MATYYWAIESAHRNCAPDDEDIISSEDEYQMQKINLGILLRCSLNIKHLQN